MKCYICHKEIPEDQIVFSYQDKYGLHHLCCERCYHYVMSLKEDLI